MLLAATVFGYSWNAKTRCRSTFVSILSTGFGPVPNDKRKIEDDVPVTELKKVYDAPLISY